jgi:hypothetical protein
MDSFKVAATFFLWALEQELDNQGELDELVFVHAQDFCQRKDGVMYAITFSPTHQPRNIFTDSSVEKCVEIRLCSSLFAEHYYCQVMYGDINYKYCLEVCNSTDTTSDTVLFGFYQFIK